MIGKVEEVRKEKKDIWKKIIVKDPLYKDAFKSSQPKEKKSVSGDQKVETQTKGHLKDQDNTTLDVETGDNPPMMDSSTTPEIQKDDTAPSGNTSAKDKGDREERKDVESAEAKGSRVRQGKRSS